MPQVPANVGLSDVERLDFVDLKVSCSHAIVLVCFGCVEVALVFSRNASPTPPNQFLGVSKVSSTGDRPNSNLNHTAQGRN